MVTITSIVFAYLCVGTAIGLSLQDRKEWDIFLFLACLLGWGIIAALAVVTIIFMSVDFIVGMIEDALGD